MAKSPASAPRRPRATRSKPAPPRKPAAATAEKRPTWTFMLFLAGDNNLDDEMIWTLKEVYRVGVPAGVRVTAQFDASARGGVRVYRPKRALDADGVFCVLHASEDSEQDSGDPDVLVRFVMDSIAAAPAENYMLILSGHGSGVIGDFLTDADSEQRRALQPGSLTIPDLTLVFRRLRQRLPATFFAARAGRTTVLDILGMDSCLMSMVEVCSEVAGEVGLLIGSEGFEPNAGWPYFRLLERLPRLRKASELAPAPLARRLARRYTTYYSDFADAGLSVDLAVCDVSKSVMGDLQKAIETFVNAYLAEIATPGGAWIDSPILLAHWRAQSYKGELYSDIADFFTLLADECGQLDAIAGDRPHSRYKAIANTARAVVRAVKGGGSSDSQVVVFNDSSGPAFQHSQGLSVYFPWSLRSYEEQYHSTAFAKRSGWDAFLERHLTRTRRPPRRLPRPPAGAAPALAVPAGLGVRTSAPSTKTSAPSSRTSAPSSRTSAPSTRFAQDMHTLLQELPSRMKNHATEFEPVVRIDAAEAPTIEAVPDAEASPDLRALKQFLANRRKGSGGR